MQLKTKLAHILDCSADMCDAVEAYGGDKLCNSSSWAGGTYQQGIERGRYGYASKLEEMQSFSQSLEVAVETPRVQWQASPVGAYPIVPEVLIGVPNAMRMRDNSKSALAPLRIFVDLFVSAGIDHDDVTKRGLAVLSLADKVSMVRPVEVICGLVTRGESYHGERLIAGFKLGHSPLNLSMACGVLDPAFIRHVTFQYAIPALGAGYSIPCPLRAGEDFDEYKKEVSEILTLAPHDLVIGPLSLGDKLTQDPVGFVRREVERLTRLEVEA